jgi:exopolyphosphatase/guanosine-5'-triphosphate,3'-diphosphate pyrophosphatase
MSGAAPPPIQASRSEPGQSSEPTRIEPRAYAALDLGTNNCRLLIASPTARGFRVLEAFSRIVRLGDGLAHTGRLDGAAMDRAMAALKICADRIRRRGAPHVRAVATQACRSAENGPDFIARVKAETGLELAIISPKEEARLSVAGCVALLDRDCDAAVVVDVGGGSTELSWIDLSQLRFDPDRRPPHPARLPIKAWLSVPIGVVTLADRFPERDEGRDAWFRAMVDQVKCEIARFDGARGLEPAFREGRAHLIGTSGAITSLAGMHLGLERYERARVDGLWMTRADCEAAADKLMGLTARQRAQQPCIGPDRADLVLAGAAILQAVQELWPCARVRVADRGLREGLLMSLMSKPPRRRRRARRPPQFAATP